MSIELKDVTYTYSPGTAYEIHALKDVSLSIPGRTVYWNYRTYRKREINVDSAFKCFDTADFRYNYL